MQDIDIKLATNAFQMFIPIEDPMAGSSTITKIVSPVLLGPNQLGVRLTWTLYSWRQAPQCGQLMASYHIDGVMADRHVTRITMWRIAWQSAMQCMWCVGKVRAALHRGARHGGTLCISICGASRGASRGAPPWVLVF